ncbi:MAG: patatin-like phospholipase family protein [Hyphomicrobiaceae bacterium]|nr:patatin-like phospholipase family protein [Hyphomicrobiaceae bacterium]
MPGDRVRVLSLDGGGAKGFYTLGVLREVETLAGNEPLYKHFDLIFGTSTGSIIAALLALGSNVDDIYQLYKEHVPNVMGNFLPGAKSRALQQLGHTVFGDQKFDVFKTNIGIVATNYDTKVPRIFKTSSRQAYTGHTAFVPGWGCTISDAVQASCSAYPFFKKKIVKPPNEDNFVLIDGGYCANNPTLYAIIDAMIALETSPERLRVLSIGVGKYPSPVRNPLHYAWWLNKYPGVRFFQDTLEINTQSMDQLRRVLYRDIAKNIIRIDQAYTEPEMATDLLERDEEKLNLLRRRGAACVREYETQLKEFFA